MAYKYIANIDRYTHGGRYLDSETRTGACDTIIKAWEWRNSATDLDDLFDQDRQYIEIKLEVYNEADEPVSVSGCCYCPDLGDAF